MIGEPDLPTSKLITIIYTSTARNPGAHCLNFEHKALLKGARTAYMIDYLSHLLIEHR